LVLALTGAAIAALARLCTCGPKINFLPRDGRAEWITFPAAVDAELHLSADLDIIFRCQFTLDNQPRSAQLNVRAAKRVELKINGTPVEIVTGRSWKDITTVDVLPFFRAGTNIIEARVFNKDAPPSLWLTLSLDQLKLRSPVVGRR